VQDGCMTEGERDELISYLRRKQCTPCRGSSHPEHPACIEADYFIDIVAKTTTRD